MDAMDEFMEQIPNTIADNALILAATRLMRERLDEKRETRYGWHQARHTSFLALITEAAQRLNEAAMTCDQQDFVDALNLTAMAMFRARMMKETPDGPVEADVGSGS